MKRLGGKFGLADAAARRTRANKIGTILRQRVYGSEAIKEPVPITESFPAATVLTEVSGAMTGTTASSPVVIPGRAELQVRLERPATVGIEVAGNVVSTYPNVRDLQQLLKFTGQSVRVLVTGQTKGVARLKAV